MTESKTNQTEAATLPNTNDPPSTSRSRQTRLLRLLVLVLVGGTIVAAVPAIEYFWFKRPIGTGPAGPDVPMTLFKNPWSDAPFVLVGLGDSVTAGYGSTRGHSYFDRMIANPDDEFPDMSDINLTHVLPNLEARNFAVSGTTSIQHMSDQLPKIRAGVGDTNGIVVLTTGGNDIIHDYGRSDPQEGAMYGATLGQAKPWIDNFDRRLHDMLEQIAAAFPAGCHVFIANIYDPTDELGDIESAGLPSWPDGSEILQAYNGVIAEAANDYQHVHLVNIHDAFLGHGIHCTKPWTQHYDWHDPHYWYFENLEDPNDRGYDVIRRLFLLEIARVLAPGTD